MRRTVCLTISGSPVSTGTLIMSFPPGASKASEARELRLPIDDVLEHLHAEHRVVAAACARLR